MTEAEYRERHREMWGKIVETYKEGDLKDLLDLKMEILSDMGYEEVWGYCFACQWVEDKGLSCNKCPISGKCGVCLQDNKNKLDELYHAIENGDQAEAVRLAEIIRDAWE